MNRLQGALGLALTAAVLSLPLAASADAVFDRDQHMHVRGSSWTFAGAWDGTTWNPGVIEYGDYDYEYTILLDVWLGHYVYDYDTGKWTQDFWMFRENLE